MFPAGLNSGLHRGEDYDPGAFFLYADADVFFYLDGGAYPGWRNLPSSWTFETKCLTRMGLRHADRFDTQTPTGLPGNWFRQPRMWAGRGIGGIPSPQLWQRLRTALMDGWLAWTGNAKRLLDDPGSSHGLLAGQPRRFR